MSKILFAVTPLVGHVNPLLPVAEHLKNEGYAVFFATADAFKEDIERRRLEFLPLLDNANYDHQGVRINPWSISGSPGPEQALI
jgi:UDP:flavonoid glycosyltransferase YjiC (YdhE family)